MVVIVVILLFGHPGFSHWPLMVLCWADTAFHFAAVLSESLCQHPFFLQLGSQVSSLLLEFLQQCVLGVLIYSGLFLDILGLNGKVQYREALTVAVSPHPMWSPLWSGCSFLKSLEKPSELGVLVGYVGTPGAHQSLCCQGRQ